MMIQSEEINSFFLFFSLTLATILLSLTLISYGLQMKKLTILCLSLFIFFGRIYGSVFLRMFIP